MDEPTAALGVQESKKVLDLIKETIKHVDGIILITHNIEHVMRVYNLAIKLAENEKVDLDVIKIAVLLHDIGGTKERKDPSGKTDHAVESAKLENHFLKT